LIQKSVRSTSVEPAVSEIPPEWVIVPVRSARSGESVIGKLSPAVSWVARPEAGRETSDMRTLHVPRLPGFG
jgi:hypothetical protein